MVKHLYFMSDTHDDLEAVSRAVDFIMAQGKRNSVIINGGDLSLRPYNKESLDSLMASAIKEGDKIKLPEDAVKQFVKEKRLYNGGVLDEYAEIYHNSGIPSLVIPGNYDGSLTGILAGDIHNRAKRLMGIKFAGYGGGGNFDDPWIGPGHMQFLYKCDEIQKFDPKELRALLDKENPSIAVIHSPPNGHCDNIGGDRHIGNHTTANYAAENNDLKLVLSGHVHTPGISAIQKTNGNKVLVVNPGNLGRFEMVDNETLETGRETDGHGTFVRIDVEDDGRPISAAFYTVADKCRAVKKARQCSEFLDLASP